MQSKTAGDSARQVGVDPLGPASGQTVRLGQVVRSVRGRDRNRWYVVVKVEASGFILVADGSRRTLARPKRKNPKHLLLYEKVISGFEDSLTDRPEMSDEQLQEALEVIASSFIDYGEEVDDAGQARRDRSRRDGH